MWHGECLHDMTSVTDDLISFALHYVFDDWEELISTADIDSAASKQSARQCKGPASASIRSVAAGMASPLAQPMANCSSSRTVQQ
jgi:hypothetical protein